MGQCHEYTSFLYFGLFCQKNGTKPYLLSFSLLSHFDIEFWKVCDMHERKLLLHMLKKANINNVPSFFPFSWKQLCKKKNVNTYLFKRVSGSKLVLTFSWPDDLIIFFVNIKVFHSMLLLLWRENIILFHLVLSKEIWRCKGIADANVQPKSM